jgi:hypothetical protein
MSLTQTEFVPENYDDANFKDFEDLEEYLFRKIADIKERAKEYYHN